MEAPILFNEQKHHLGAVRAFVLTYEGELSQLQSALKPIGTNLMDFYYGSLSLEEIYHELRQQLQAIQCWEATAFSQWLEAKQGFQTIALSDDSTWVLRQGNSAQYYIHLHPGRYSPHTIRIKATSLKTAIAVRVLVQRQAPPLDLATLNHLRSEYLGLSPVKNLLGNQSFNQLMNWLQ